jgi:flagellar FliL protein
MHTYTLPSLILLLASLSPNLEAEEGPPAQPSYHELSPSLVANLARGGNYVRCDIQLMTLDPDRLPEVQLHAPAVRHALLMLLAEQDGSNLDTPAGKEALRQEALALTRRTLQELTGEEGVEELFFTAFFVQ